MSTTEASPSIAQDTSRIARRHAQDDDLIVGVSVPATSANLGPGYDSFGLALAVPLVVVAGARQERRVVAVGQGADELPPGEDNLVWQGVLAWCAHAGKAVPDVSVKVDSAIPLQRGMGSSSAAAVAGLFLGRALTGGTATTEQMLGLATDLEGHADNAAAAIAGGLVACTPDGRLRRVTPSPALRPVLIVPSLRQSTNEARGVLPQQVSLAVAAANGARAAATFAGLAGLIPLDARDMVDALHEPARLPRMPDSQAVIESLRTAGVACALSGSGPTVLAVVGAHDPEAVQQVRDIVAQTLTDQAGDVEILAVAWDLAGTTVCPPNQTLGPAA